MSVKPAFCGSCVRERTDLELTELDGRPVWLCWDCREGPASLYSFDEPAVRHDYGAHWRKDGNRTARKTGRRA